MPNVDNLEGFQEQDPEHRYEEITALARNRGYDEGQG